MSNNASNQFSNLRALRTHQAERQLDLQVASASLADAYADDCYARRPSFRRFVSWSGLAALDKAANEAFGGENSLPWNLLLTQKEWQRCRAARNSGGSRGYYPREVNDQRVASTARFVGWLQAAAKFRSLRKAILRSVSSRGMNSLATRVNLWVVAERRPSPGQLARAMEAVKERADALVGSFIPGHRVSWYALLQAVVYGPRQTCKAAIMAAAMTLLPDASIRLYRDARNALAALASAKVRDTSDGVVGWRMEAPMYSQEGISVYTLYTVNPDRFGFKELRLVRRKDGRTFHNDPDARHYSGTRYISGPEGQVLQAMEAWKEQDVTAAYNCLRHEDLVRFIEGETMGYCPLFVLNDSYKAGNCQFGTQAWMADRGWSQREIVSGRELIPFLGDERIARVIRRRLIDATDTAQAA